MRQRRNEPVRSISGLKFVEADAVRFIDYAENPIFTGNGKKQVMVPVRCHLFLKVFNTFSPCVVCAEVGIQQYHDHRTFRCI